METRGKEFGIVRVLDILGSVIGPLLLFSHISFKITANIIIIFHNRHSTIFTFYS
jgi:hypothetical protein